MVVMPDTNSADFSALADDLAWAAKNANMSVMGLLDTYAVRIQELAQQNAPVDTGLLRSQIKILRSPGKIVIGVDPEVVDYAGFQEYGTTGPYTIEPKNGKALAFNSGGKMVIVRKVTHPGVKAHPYIRPALQQFLRELGPAAADVGVHMITTRHA